MRRWIGATLVALTCSVGCKSKGSEPQQQAEPGEDALGPKDVALASWGEPDLGPDPQLLVGEVKRDLASARSRAEAATDPEETRRAVLSAARVGGRAGAQLLIDHLDGAGDKAVNGPGLLDADELAPDLAEALETSLWSRYALTEDETVRAGMAFSLARLGGASSVARFSIEAGSGPERAKTALMGLGILCARGKALTDFSPLIAGLAPGALVASEAAFATSRCVGPSAELLSDKELRAELKDALVITATTLPDANARRLGFRALASLGEAFEMPAATGQSLVGSVPEDPATPQWLVEVEGVRALASFPTGRGELVERLAAHELSAFEGARVQVLFAALLALAPSSVKIPMVADAGVYRGLADRIRAHAAKQSGRDAEVWALLHCHAELLAAAHDGNVDALESCGEELPSEAADLPEVLLVDALIYGEPSTSTREERVAALMGLAGPGKPPIVRQAALSALATVDAAQVNPLVRAALSDKDVGVATAAASVASARAVDAARRDPEAVDPLLAMATDDRVEWMEARVSALAALATLAQPGEAAVRPEASGAEVPEPSEEPAGPPPWVAQAVEPLGSHAHAAVRSAARRVLAGDAAALERFDRATIAAADFGSFTTALADESEPWGLDLETTAGHVIIDFSGSAAILNQRNLGKLAQQGLYAGTRLHRVVPGFVVQGGDPRGDGYGGPGHFVPCERSSIKYERGTVGIALAGKDTGGSQFFITHAPQPHLDGRYTVVGQVVEGMEVVDGLMPTDRIVGVTVLAERP